MNNIAHTFTPESDSSSSSSSDEEDDDELQVRLIPCWNYYRSLLEKHGFRLETVRDVRAFYDQLCQQKNIDCHAFPGYIRTRGATDDNEILRDAGLVRIVHSFWCFCVSNLLLA